MYLRSYLKKMKKRFYVYILTNTSRMLYTGVTNDLVRRIKKHQNKLIEGFTKKYNLHKLVYYEEFQNPEKAIAREKEIKGWRREKKVQLIRRCNPCWKDLSQFEI